MLQALNSDNNEIIEANQLNDCNKIMNYKQKNPFLYNSIKSLTSKKSEENDEYISSKEYISYIDNKLNDDNENIFNIFCEGNKDGFSLTKLAKTAKELGDDNTANKMMKLIEQAKLFNKEITLDEFQDILNDDYDNDNNIKSSNESEDFEEKENSNLKLKKEEEDKKTISSKNEDPKENEADKTNKRYHRRYRDTKNKSENNDKVNNNNKYKGQTKYRKNK